MKKFCLLVNPVAANGTTIKNLPRVQAALTKLGLDFRTVISESLAQTKSLASRAIMQGEALVIYGGDGTLRAIANIVYEQNGKLGIIPAGRGNDLARTLNIPVDPIAACKILAQGNTVTIDMGRVNGQYFLGICSVGFDSMANDFVSRARFLPFIKGGAGVYIYGGLRALIGWKHTKFKLIIDGKKILHEGFNVAIANSPCYGGGMYLAPQASVQDGLLNVILVGKIPKYKILALLPRLFKKEIITHPDVTLLTAKQVHIEAEPHFTVYADGDAISATPVDVSILPKSLCIYAPLSQTY